MLLLEKLIVPVDFPYPLTGHRQVINIPEPSRQQDEGLWLPGRRPATTEW
jgi:hypothetical protein